MYFVYILESQQNRNLYTGFTEDLGTRIKAHLMGKVYSTIRWQPWKLIYFEVCLSKVDALQREKYLKTGRGERFIKDRLKYYFKKRSNLTHNTNPLAHFKKTS